ncbi:hypothetical protein MTAT_03930 [Moorella thermoacetica]|uniref:Phosphate acetyltransferase n=1 Tax=Neomoorella thermoacetica TaxID=1525 RepID=A0AAC9HJ17_NEOTH|nr:phosphate acyltransferase [Moorella thermoacetica]AOQ24803.1 Phosphate acetyltransferase [Moorella thermoacetica]TYL15659.1 hypothetical protein MTAT_03930 [Moorella thermoacetica]
MLRNFQEVIDKAQQLPLTKVVIAPAAAKEATSGGAIEANGLARVILVGEKPVGEVSHHCQWIRADDPIAAVEKGASLLASGAAEIIVKGQINTSDFMRVLLRKEYRLRQGKLISHVAVVEMPQLKRLIIVTDGGMVIEPDEKQLVQIVLNALPVAEALGMANPRIALLSANEKVNENFPSTVRAARVVASLQRQINGHISGPLSLDLALSKEAAAIKGIQDPVAGSADILVVPNIEVGNTLVKSLVYFAGASMAGILVGAARTIIVTSRAASEETKLYSVALARLVNTTLVDKKINSLSFTG